LLLAGAAAAQDKSTIDKLNTDFEQAFAARDYAKVANFYTEDAYLLPSGSPLVHGRAAIQAFWTKAGDAISDFKLKTVDVKPLSPTAAREIGSFSLTLKGAQPQQATGKYVVVWEKVGNDWKLATDIWNADH
jgi:uncharacterized protein (TIGR02246 family)